MKESNVNSNNLNPAEGDVIAVWFSCGAASAIAAAETIRLYRDICTVRVLNNPVVEEDADNQRFLKDVEKWLGVTVESVVNKAFPEASAVEVWNKKQYMSGIAGAPCTAELKKRARQQWEQKNHVDWHVLGFTSDEEKRLTNFRKTERGNVLGVLVDQSISKADCFNRLFMAGLKLPAIYNRGYPNANCIGCVKATSPTYWNHVRDQDPEVFSARATQSRRIGAKLARCHPRFLSWCYMNDAGFWIDTRPGAVSLYDSKGHLKSPRVYLDELPNDAKGAALKSMQVECGIFCEEKLEEPVG